MRLKYEYLLLKTPHRMVRGSFYPKDDHFLELINYLLFLLFAFFLAMLMITSVRNC